MMNPETNRLVQAREPQTPWQRWRPNLSQRKWGTVREDCSPNEYFHGDNGACLGSSHQTGPTGLVAKTMELCGLLDAEPSLAEGRNSMLAKDQPPLGRTKP